MPANTTASIGTFSQCSLNGSAFEYKTFGLVQKQEIVSTDGIRGTRSHPSERTRPGRITCSGPVVIEPGPADLDVLLPLVLGGSKSNTNTIGLTETLPTFTTVVDRILTVDSYAGCCVDRGTIRGGEGEPIELELQIEALTETQGAAGSFAGTASTASPYVFMDATFSVGGTTILAKSFEVTIDNRLKKDRFMNQLSRVNTPPLDRIVEVVLTVPLNGDTNAFRTSGVTTEAVTITLTNGANSCTLTIAGVEFEPSSPSTPGREEELLTLRGQARSVGATAAIVITNVG